MRIIQKAWKRDKSTLQDRANKSLGMLSSLWQSVYVQHWRKRIQSIALEVAPANTVGVESHFEGHNANKHKHSPNKYLVNNWTFPGV